MMFKLKIYLYIYKIFKYRNVLKNNLNLKNLFKINNSNI